MSRANASSKPQPSVAVGRGTATTGRGIEGDDLLQRHPPERRERQARGVMLYSCCCCCCCCLHSFGAAIGAALGGNYRGGTNPFAESLLPSATQEPPRRMPSTQGIYWTSLLIAIVLSLVVAIGWSLMESGTTRTPRIPELLLGMGFLFILTAPAWFLAALPIMAVRIAVDPGTRADSRYWWSLGRITLGIVLGTLGGIAAMLAMLLPFLGR
jgi:hypothetical protein